MKFLFALFLCLSTIYGDLQPERSNPMQLAADDSLYKVLTLRNWLSSLNSQTVKLAADDYAFIHFSRIDQLPASSASIGPMFPTTSS